MLGGGLVAGGPADLGRILKPNDKIIAVAEKGGEPVEVYGLKIRKIVDKIRGKKGTEVVVRDSQVAVRDVLDSGRLGDLVGRKRTFLITIVLMGVSTALVGLLGPMLIVAMGVFVTAIVFAMLMPIFEMNTLVR